VNDFEQGNIIPSLDWGGAGGSVDVRDEAIRDFFHSAATARVGLLRERFLHEHAGRQLKALEISASYGAFLAVFQAGEITSGYSLEF
jgi:hypothetical protein